MVASCTPCDASATVSRSGHFVALMRLRNSVSSASGTFTRNGRIACACSLPRCVALDWVMVSSFLVVLDFWFVLQLILEHSLMGGCNCDLRPNVFWRRR